MSPGGGAKSPLAGNYWHRRKNRLGLRGRRFFVFGPPLTCCVTTDLFPKSSEPGFVPQACADGNANLAGLLDVRVWGTRQVSMWWKRTVHERRPGAHWVLSQ